MGTTSATLHVALSRRADSDLTESLVKAYARLGWANPKRGQEATRSVRLARNAAPFVSIHDSACEALDDGALKQLAALLSKSLNTAAIVATVHDSDAFEFLLYHEGKQVDAITDSSDGFDVGVKTLSGKRRATKWLEALGRDWMRTLGAGPYATSLVALETFMSRAKAIEGMTTPFSEQRLEAWCELAGLPASAATATGDERENEGAVVARLDLAPRPVAAKSGAEKAAPAGRALAHEFSPDDHPYHGYFPAAWPMPPAAKQGFSWAVVCRDGGIEQFALRVEIERAGEFALCDLSVEARPFYNGQITSERVLAAAERSFARPEAVDAATFALEAPGFHLPAPAQGSRTHAILLLKVRVHAGWRGEVTLKPTVVADGVELSLPPLRVAVTVPTWSPFIAEGAKLDALRLVRILRLNQPSVRSAVAILPHDGADTLAQARRLIERAMPPQRSANIRVTLDSQKHLSPSFKVPKSRAELAFDELTAAPVWPKLFDPNADYQTVRIGLTAAGAPWPYAGFSVTTTLREQIGQAKGRSGPTTSVAIWGIAEPKAREAVGLDWDRTEETFRDFLREAGVLQAWLADCAWIPEFDTYEDFHQTLYENVSPVDWFSSGLRGGCTSQLWSRRYLRFVSSRMWLGDDLARAVDRAALASSADISPVREGYEIVLKPGVELVALERALSPILPNVSQA